MGKDNIEKVKKLIAGLDPTAPLGDDFEYASVKGLERGLREAEKYLQKAKDFQPRRYTHPDDVPFRNKLIREYEEKIAMIQRARERINNMTFDTVQERDALVQRVEDIARRLKDAPVKGEES